MGKTAIIIVAAIAVVAVAAAGLYFFVLNNEKHDYLEYTVTSTSPGVTVDGTMRITFLGETDTQMQIKFDYNFNITAEGATISVKYSETEWVDKDADIGWDMGEKKGTAVIDTKWGPKNVDIYEETDGGETIRWYIAGKIPYKMELITPGYTLTVQLSKTNML